MISTRNLLLCVAASLNICIAGNPALRCAWLAQTLEPVHIYNDVLHVPGGTVPLAKQGKYCFENGTIVIVGPLARLLILIAQSATITRRITTGAISVNQQGKTIFSSPMQAVTTCKSTVDEFNDESTVDLLNEWYESHHERQHD